MLKYQFDSRKLDNPSEWYRLFTSALLHADGEHLIGNMMMLAISGYYLITKRISPLSFLGLYIGGILFSSYAYYYLSESPTIAIGASGGVSAVVSAAFFIDPISFISSIFQFLIGQVILIIIGAYLSPPNFLLKLVLVGVILYLFIPNFLSFYIKHKMRRWKFVTIQILFSEIFIYLKIMEVNDNIGHMAHFGGIVYGFLFCLFFLENPKEEKPTKRKQEGKA